jgi:N-glycosylase/DNA lyase
VNLFRLGDDLPLFYEKFRNEKISQSFNEFRGLRLMKASNPFESLICSVCSQHSSVEQWNKTIRRIQNLFGRIVKVPDGEIFHAFPSPETLAKASTAKLESCQAGYRAQYIISVSKKIVDGDLDLEKLKDTSYEKAKNELIQATCD